MKTRNCYINYRVALKESNRNQLFFMFKDQTQFPGGSFVNHMAVVFCRRQLSRTIILTTIVVFACLDAFQRLGTSWKAVNFPKGRTPNGKKCRTTFPHPNLFD